MTDFGFPVGPCTLLDEVGIDVAARVAGVMQRAFGDRMAPPASMAALLGDGRKGRKASRGFYSYDGSRKRVDESVYAVLPYGASRRPLDTHQTQERLVFSFLNEVVRCLQEGVLRSPRDGDVGAVFGLGFPPFLGGPFRHLDRLGARFALETMEKLELRARAAARRPGPGGPDVSCRNATDSGPLNDAGRTEARVSRRNGRVLLKRPAPPGTSVVQRRFIPLLGKRRTLEILPVLTQAYAAYCGLKRSAKAIRGRGANVFTQWVGDPDALGSAVLLTAILRKLGAEEVRILTGSLGHPQNRNLVERCGLKLLDPNKDRLQARPATAWSTPRRRSGCWRPRASSR